MYIVIDGIDGAGKSTLVSSLSDCLRTHNITAIVLGEPTHGQYGQKARRLIAAAGARNPQEEHRLFTLDRQEHVEKKIKPLLKFAENNLGFVLIQDRGYLSAPAYQAENDEEMLGLLQEQRDIAPEPDHFFIIDLPVDVALARIQGRAKGSVSIELSGCLDKVRERYLQLAKTVDEQVSVLDGEQDTQKLCGQIIEILGLGHKNS